MFSALQQIARATNEARARTGEKRLTTEAQSGRVRLCVIVREGRKTASIPAGPWESIPEVIRRMESLSTLQDVAQAMATR